MNNTFPLEQISRVRNIDANLKLRHQKLDLLARFMEINSINLKMKQKETEKELGYSSSTLQCYRKDITKRKSL